MKYLFSLLSLFLISYQLSAICFPVNSCVATNITSTQATLNWVPASGALSFSSVYRVLGNPTWTSGPGPLSQTTTSQTLSGLLPSTTYQYGIQAQCAGLTVSTLFIIQFTTLPVCNAPNGLLATSILYSSASLNWNIVAGASSYRLEYKPASSGTWLLLSATMTGNSYGLTGLISGTLYDYRVRTNCTGSSSSYTQAQFSTLIIPCTPPNPVFASSITSTQATINWNVGVGSNSSTLEYKLNTSSTWLVAIASTTSLSFVLSGLQSSTTYDIRVKSNCASSSSTYTQSQFTTLSSVICNSPSNISATNISSSQATISWGTVASALSYTFEFTNNLSSGLWNIMPAQTANSYIMLSLTPSTTFYVRVKSNCAGSVSSPYTATIQFTTLPCSPPSGLFASSITSSTAILNWSVVTGAVDYAVGYKQNTSSTWIWNIVPSSSSTFNIAGLIPLTVYDFQVATYCVGGSSSTYSTSQFTTTASNCGLPVNLSTLLMSSNQATFLWDAVAGATSYYIQYRIVGGSVLWSNTGTAMSNSFTANNLQFSTLYEWQVQAVCSSGISAFTNSTFFSTQACLPPIGSSILNPIIVGQAPCITNPFINTQNTLLPNCFLNNLIAPDNQASPDIWYRFTLANATTVEISHCGSFTNSLNTYVHLLNSGGSQIISNDNNGPLCLGNKASISISLLPGTYYVVSEGTGTSLGAITTSIKTTDPCNSVLNLTLFIEGYYTGGLTMTPAMFNQGYAGLPAALPIDVDDIVVELRDANFPFLIIVATTTRLKTNGSAICTFPSVTGNFYIVVKHRNALSTWSKFPVYISSGTTTYTFHNAVTKAYGDNMIQVEPGIWALYAGDFNFDENIDLIDLTILESDIITFQFGYFATDINGDGNVDLLDGPNVEDNVNNFIFVSKP